MSILWEHQEQYKKVTLDWENIEASTLEAGTPIGSDGQVHNDQYAIGLLVERATRPWAGKVDILVSGFVDWNALSAEIEDTARKAMYAIIFVDNGRLLPLPIDQSVYELPIASAIKLGGVKIGNNISIDEDGTISAEGSYELPIASDDTLGGVKIGNGLEIEEDGTVNVTVEAVAG